MNVPGERLEPHMNGRSFTHAPAVILCEESRSTPRSVWTDALVVSRRRRDGFNVYARKQGDIPDVPNSRRWRTVIGVFGVNEPGQLAKHIQTCGEAADFELDWVPVTAKLARLDWAIATAIARSKGVTLPPLPSLKVLCAQLQRYARRDIKLRADWEHRSHEVEVTFPEWMKICDGEPATLNAIELDEGRCLNALWHVDRNAKSSLVVDYVGDETHCHVGSLGDADINGFELYGVDICRAMLLADVESKSER